MPEEGIGTPGIGVTSCELGRGFWASINTKKKKNPKKPGLGIWLSGKALA